MTTNTLKSIARVAVGFALGFLTVFFTAGHETFRWPW